MPGRPAEAGRITGLRVFRLSRVLAGGSLLWVLGCASGGSPPAAAPRGAPPAAAPRLPSPSAARFSFDSTGGLFFTRRVRGIEVRDSAGRPQAAPFLGGFDLPRPQLVDIDADGDLDLFVQERSDALMWFENVGRDASDAGALPTYRWRTDHYQGLHVGEWYRFADMDGDGDADLLAEQPFSLIRLYRNVGTREKARFVAVADTLRLESGEPLFADRQNIPNVADIDCNGRLDLLVGRLDGTVVRYEALGGIEAGAGAAAGAGAGAPRFRLVTEHFQGIEIVRQFGSRHGANTLALADLDGDGDEDLLWGDYFEPGLLYLENTGSCVHPDLSGEPAPFPAAQPLRTSGYNAPAIGDMDGDGDLDVLVGVLGGAYDPSTTAADNLVYLERTGPGTGGAGAYSVRTRRFITQIDVGSESAPALADLDGDGDLDLLLGSKIAPGDHQSGRIRRFENVGSPRRPVFRDAGVLPISGTYHYVPALGDLDGDGDPDLALGTWNRGVIFFRNEGARGGGQGGGKGGAFRFVQEDSASTIRLTRGQNATPALVDIDADGDLDLFVGEGSGELNFYRNTGSASNPRFELVTDKYLEIDVGRRSAPGFADADGDGDPDLFLGSEANGVAYFRNDGTPASPSFVPAGTLPTAGPALTPSAARAPNFAIPALGDVNGDGAVDLFLGGSAGGLRLFKGTLGG